MKNQALDDDHFKECHERWTKNRNRNLASDQMKNESLDSQCLCCAYYVPVVGKLSEDYGVCTNGRSSRDGMVMFEHDGCDVFILSDDFLQFSIEYKIIESDPK